jgi:hypothetical protein
MTNKLPEVGKRYKDKKTQEILILERVQTIKNHKWYFLETDYGVVIAASTYQFKNDYESLNNEQEDKQEKIMQAHAESGKFGSDKVEEVKEELKAHIKSFYGDIKQGDVAYGLYAFSQNLLNALDTQQEMSQLVADKTDKGSEDENKGCETDGNKESIWVGKDCPNEQAALDWNTEEPVKKTEKSLPKYIINDEERYNDSSKQLMCMAEEIEDSGDLIKISIILKSLLKREKQNTKRLDKLELLIKEK